MGPSLTIEQLLEAVASGFSPSSAYPNIVTCICHELSTLYGLDERVNYDESGNYENLLMELSALLAELGREYDVGDV